MPTDVREILGTVVRHTEATRRVRDVDPDERLTVYVYLTPDPPDHDGARDSRTPEQRRELWTVRHADDVAAITALAAEHGLEVESVTPDWRRVTLGGAAAQVGAAFRVSLGVYEQAGAEFRSYSGPLSVPAALAEKIETVGGLDNRQLPRRPANARAIPADGGSAGFLPTQIAELYRFPTNANGAGQTIGLIEMGGGYRESDLAAAFAAMGLPVPEIVFYSVDGSTNTPGVPGNEDADLEVALDIQVAGGMANGAKLVVYMAPGYEQYYFLPTLMAAINDSVNNPSVLSISVGWTESNWTTADMNAVGSEMQTATGKNIAVFAASGDSLATGGQADGKAHVSFPASHPWVIGCGGTSIGTSGSSISSEVTWNTGSAGTGGGISDVFPVPGYQGQTTLPPHVGGGGPGRGVPDVAATAVDYQVYLDGGHGNEGGTSAVAPLWAALAARLNQVKAPWVLPPALGLPLWPYFLYLYPQVLRDITAGNNRPASTPALGYDAGPGWDACTGLGVPDGGALAIAMSRAAVVGSPIAAARFLDSSAHVRLYCLNQRAGIDEYCWDGGWTAGARLPQATLGGGLAAVDWADAGGAHVRVYYQDAQNLVREHAYEAGEWQAGATLATAASGSGLAATRWLDDDGVHIRIYYQNAQNLICEHAYDGGRWQSGATLVAAPAGSSLTAALWNDAAGTHVRLYYLDAHSIIREYCYDSGHWGPGATLPAAGADSGLGAGAWYDGAGAHVRVYYVDAKNMLCESYYDGGWQVGTLARAAADSSVTATLWTDAAGAHIRVYYKGDQQALHEYCYDPSGWQPGRLVVLAQAASA